MVGLYYAFLPQSTPTYTTVSQTADGKSFVSTKFQYVDSDATT